ncbi:MAG: hypothetical protein JRI23_30995 [Deltaproteobacteria bacterium]|nr:hypothetical protein [Deltaproteobacteria bacterium]MBW2536629.1 hypothetical protein [Deltaproteobacteria bacterium]
MVGDAEIYETMDVVLYTGHAGLDPSSSGIEYHYNPRRFIPALELADANLPAKSQLFMFAGCKTYSVYPDAVYTSNTKSAHNLDIISTVGFGWAPMRTKTATRMLGGLLATADGTHDPRTFLEILRKLSAGQNETSYYGVHGVDDNAHLSPYANLGTLCQSCDSSSACPGEGNLCVRLSAGKACGVECTADDACPNGYRCTAVGTSSGESLGRQCLPVDRQCG